MTYDRCVATVAVFLGFVAGCSCQALRECPPVDDRDANATLLANAYNCSAFYICRQGTPLKFECPANLHFNDRLKVCDYPLNASCVPLSTQELPELVTTEVAVTDVDVSEGAAISETAADVDVDGADVVTVAEPVISTIAIPAESSSDDVDHSLDQDSGASVHAFCGYLAGPGGSARWIGAAWLPVRGRHGCQRDASCQYELRRLLPL